MKMINPTAEDVGRKVIYYNKEWMKSKRIETGVIMYFNNNYVSVRYGNDTHSKSTRREDLIWGNEPPKYQINEKSEKIKKITDKIKILSDLGIFYDCGEEYQKKLKMRKMAIQTIVRWRSMTSLTQFMTPIPIEDAIPCPFCIDAQIIRDKRKGKDNYEIICRFCRISKQLCNNDESVYKGMSKAAENKDYSGYRILWVHGMKLLIKLSMDGELYE